MIAVIKFLGTNCHQDIVSAYKKIGKECIVLDSKKIYIPQEIRLVVLAGGFSYGDYLRCGAIAARESIISGLREYIANGGLVLGICNGFQILCEAKILPGVLMKNKNLKFMSMNARLKINDNDNDLLRDYRLYSIINIPIANMEGNYQVDIDTLDDMRANNQIVLKYEYDLNGSVERIAGICNKEKNVFGIMPHPERAINIKSINTINPHFSSNNMDGFLMLKSLVK